MLIAGALLIAAGIVMNGVSLTAPPGFGPRLRRYLFSNWAATSQSGSGSADCASLSERSTGRTRAAAGGYRFPELTQRGFPGLSQPALFDVAEQTARRLAGWKILRADRSSYTLSCTYTTRFFHFVDDIKIAVMPDSEIALCSQSRGYLGDLGGNIANIENFYLALAPGIDREYRDVEERARRRLEHRGWR